MKVQPQTVGNSQSHVATVYGLARPAWGYPLDLQVIDDACKVCKSLGLSSRSKARDRRPTLEELDKLMKHFWRVKRKNAIPMQEIICYAIFSARRQDEITRQSFEDLDEDHSEIWVRDMKHPGEKEGNDVRYALTQEALAIILNRRKSTEQKGRIFPHHGDSVSSSFTNACALLGIDDPHFHDLRHDGISRLFELGWNIPNVASSLAIAPGTHCVGTPTCASGASNTRLGHGLRIGHQQTQSHFHRADFRVVTGALRSQDQGAVAGLRINSKLISK
ncbi:tyrosine-type recombinase/integrase [Variovorax paradoxus]|uniref:tyrosine-type recombinase/integrase n=1 Tax=Variovorax paradoxus TaxID=34073 RepID=UPI001F5EB5C7|nr:tyrosine-type recombinase/integrase [Variovorax paradoxus]